MQIREQKLFDLLSFGVSVHFTYSGGKYGQELLAAKHEHKLELQFLNLLVQNEARLVTSATRATGLTAGVS